MTRFTRGNSPPGNGDHLTPELDRGDGQKGHQAFTALRLWRERDLDLRRRDHRAIHEWQLALVEDLGGQTEVDTFQRAMIDRATECLIVLNAMANHVEAGGIMKGDDLAPCLKTSFLAYQNSFRLALTTCYEHGQKGKGKKKPLDLEDYLKSKEESQNERHPGSEEKEGEFTQ
jgi:hypothetical protein